MSKPLNFLDLIKNPDKIADLNKKQGTSPSQSCSVTPKEAVIPPNLSGAQKNEWQEMQKKNQLQNESKNDDDVIFLDKNPFIRNGSSSENKKPLQKPVQQLQRNSDNHYQDINHKNAQEKIKLPTNIQQTPPPIKQNILKFEDDQINYRPNLNKQNSRGSSAISQNLKTDSNKNFTIEEFRQNRDANNPNRNQQQQYPLLRSSQTGNIQVANKGSFNNIIQSNRSANSLLSNSSNGMSKQEKLRAKYSLQQQSKQDYKKIFSHIVKEYSDEENRYYDSNKTKSTTYIIYTLIVIILVMGFFDIIARNTPKFCQKEYVADTPSCKKCPEFADCKNYVMRCNDGYIQMKNYTCIMNPTLISNTKSFIIDKITKLQYENGHHQCFQQHEEEKQIQKIKFESLKKELSLRLDDSYSITSQNEVLKKFLQNEANQREYEFTYNDDTLSTNRLRFTLFCKIKILFHTHYYAIVVSIVLLGILIILGIHLKHKIKQRQIAGEIYDELVSQIQQSSEKQINISYYKEGIVSHYKHDFNEDVWILVDRKRFNEKKINVYRDYDGLYWSQI